MGGKLAQKTVVDPAAGKEVKHFVTQMKGVKLCVWVVFIFSQPHQVIGGDTIELCQCCDGKGADILEIFRLILS